MLSENDARQTIGSTAYSSDGDKIGTVGQLFLDDETGRPEFITVNTGLFGNKETYIPVSDATFDGDRLTVPFSKEHVKGAPNVDTADGHLDRPDEERLYQYYNLQYSSSSRTGDAGTSGRTTDGLGDSDRSTTTDSVTGTNSVTDHDRDGIADRDRAGIADRDTDSTTGRSSGVRHTEGHDTSGPTTDDAMTRSEEHLQVGTTSQEAGRVRLRKYVTTEQETQTVPVSREQAVLEREPITDANVGDAASGPDISEEEHEVVLSEERPTVSKTTEPVERVRLGTETVTDQETVTEEVRKEHIEPDGDVDRR
jgi:uncharacterized protein (TIGR02271 family)